IHDLSPLHLEPRARWLWELGPPRRRTDIDDFPTLVHLLVEPVAIVRHRLSIIREPRGLIPISPQSLGSGNHSSLHILADHHGPIGRHSRTKVRRDAVAADNEPGPSRSCGWGVLASGWCGDLIWCAVLVVDE